MILQQICLTLLVLITVLRLPRAVRAREARPAWWSSITGAISLTTYGFPIPTGTYEHLLGDQGLLTLLRDLAGVTALWFLREALAGYARSSRRYSRLWRLGTVLTLLTVLFLLIPGRTTPTRTIVMDRIDQPFSWIYGVAYMGATLWILVDSIRVTLPRGRGAARALVTGAALMAAGCVIEIAVLTAAHFGWGGPAFGETYGEISSAPFFIGLVIALTTIGVTTVVLPARRRVTVGQLHWITRGLLPHRRPLPLTLLGSEKQIVARTHHLLVAIGNAQQAGRFIPTSEESAVIRRAQDLCRPDGDFQPTTIGKAA